MRTPLHATGLARRIERMARVLLLAAAVLVTAGVGGESRGRHTRPVPILMYHVIAAPPAGLRTRSCSSGRPTSTAR